MVDDQVYVRTRHRRTTLRDAVNGGGITLQELIDLWDATRDRPMSSIAPQFELNRFARAWHAASPGGTHAQMLAAWAAHRARPREAGIVDATAGVEPAALPGMSRCPDAVRIAAMTSR